MVQHESIAHTVSELSNGALFQQLGYGSCDFHRIREHAFLQKVWLKTLTWIEEKIGNYTSFSIVPMICVDDVLFLFNGGRGGEEEIEGTDGAGEKKGTNDQKAAEGFGRKHPSKWGQES